MSPCAKLSPTVGVESEAGGLVVENVVNSFLVEFGAIQSPSGTGFSTGFVGLEKLMVRPVELLRGGMALGDGKFSDTIASHEIR